MVQYTVVTTVLFFPLTVYQNFFREHQYGLATQTFGPWFKEQMIALGVSLVMGVILFIPLYGVFRKAPRTWWIWGAAVGVAFVTFAMMIYPVFLAPLFNTYTALEDPAVAEPILSMARANGVDADTVYQFDASRQSTRISANVAGALGTMRIALNDNLLNRCSHEEIQTVMAHELAHYVLNHVYESIAFMGVMLLAGFAFVRWTFDRVVARWGSRWGVQGIGDVAGLPVLAALISVFFFFGTPVTNNFIRLNEVQADLVALNVARQPEGFAEVSLKLAEYRKLEPGPVEEWIFYDHPSGRSRISMAMRWKAEQLKRGEEQVKGAQ